MRVYGLVLAYNNHLLARVGAGFVTADSDRLKAPVVAAEREGGGKDGLHRRASVRRVVKFVLRREYEHSNRQNGMRIRALTS